MKDRIIKVMAEVFECQIPDNALQTNIEKWDSLRHLNLMIGLEMEFDIELEPEEIASMKSLTEIAKVIQSKI